MKRKGISGARTPLLTINIAKGDKRGQISNSRPHTSRTNAPFSKPRADTCVVSEEWLSCLSRAYRGVSIPRNAPNSAMYRLLLMHEPPRRSSSSSSNNAFRLFFFRPSLFHLIVVPSGRGDGLRLAFDKVQGVLGAHAVDGARLVVERHAVAFICHVHNLGPERGADELRAGLVGDGLEQRRHRGSVLRVQVGVHFVENDHGTALRLLERKDQA